jgi:hypothetical protein
MREERKEGHFSGKVVESQRTNVYEDEEEYEDDQVQTTKHQTIVEEEDHSPTATAEPYKPLANG